MPLTRVTVSSLAEFDAALAAALATPGARVFTLFSGATTASGASWCPDCDAAKPALAAAFDAAGATGAVTLITAPLVQAEYKGNAAHWARAHARVKLQRIPTLHKWGAAKKVGELVEGDCADEERVRELVLE
jgi:hypothetical protein